MLRRRNRIFLSAALSCVLPWTAFAEDVTSDSATPAFIAEAMQNNPEIIALEQAVEGAKGEIRIARKWENPELSVLPAWKRTPSTRDESGSSAFQGTLELGQLIEYPGKRVLRRAIAEKEVAMAETALSGFRFQLAAKVEKSIYEVVLAKELHKLRGEQVQSSTEFAEATKQRAESGYASDVEAVRAQAELIAAKKSLGDAESALKQAQIELASLLGRDPRALVQVSLRIEQLPEVAPTSDSIEHALKENPNLKAQLLSVEKAELDVTAAKLSRHPDLTAGPSIEYSDDEQVYGISVSVPLPLWDDKSGEIQKAEAEQRKAKAELQALRREISAAALSSAEKLRLAQKQVALFSPAFRKQLKNAMQQAERSYATTGTTALLYLDAKRTYFETLADYYDSLRTFIDAFAELQAAVGAPIEHQSKNNR
ncbi:MAG: TolC family protein [Bdellovibrionota bacterium]